MKVVTLRNDFHNRSHNVKPKKDLQNRLYVDGYTIRYTRSILCGVKGCTCSDKIGSRPTQGWYEPEKKRYYLYL